MNTMIDKEKVKKYFSGEFSEEDKLYAEELFNDENRREELKDFLGKWWDEYCQKTDLPEKDLDHIFHKLYFNIHQKEENHKSRFINLNKFLKMAAVLVLAAFLTILLFDQFFKEEPKQVAAKPDIITKETPKGVKTQLKLPDGTRVWLNSESKLFYPAVFSDASRNIELRGEAFFDVVENKNKPFIIQTPYFSTTVLGTSFSIKAYSDLVPKVSLVEGRVKVTKLGSSWILNPNEQIYFQNGEMQLGSFDFNEEIAWKDGVLSFNDLPLNAVFDKIERWYGVKIEYNKNQTIESKYYSGHHENQSLESLLKGLGYSLNFSFNLEGKSVKIMFNKN